jgi:hypothetical protein
MALLDVLAPEIFSLEELGAFRHFATVSRIFLLFYELRQLFLDRLIHGLSAQFGEVNILGLENLEQLILKGLDPIERTLQLLLGFGGKPLGAPFLHG